MGAARLSVPGGSLRFSRKADSPMSSFTQSLRLAVIQRCRNDNGNLKHNCRQTHLTGRYLTHFKALRGPRQAVDSDAGCFYDGEVGLWRE